MMEYIMIMIWLIGMIAGIFFLQLLFGNYLLETEKEILVRRIMKYGDETICQLPHLKQVLFELDDMLARSLPPEEYESDEMLEKMDTVKKQIQAENTWLIAFLSSYYELLSERDIAFRCKVGIPDFFQNDILEGLILYDYLLAAGLDAIEQEKRKQSEKEAAETFEAKQIRIRESSQFGLWHLHMDVTVSASNWESAKGKGLVYPRCFHTYRGRCLMKKLLNKYHLKWQSKFDGDKFEIDIITK